MIPSKYVWSCKEPDATKVKGLVDELHISTLLAALLVNRGINQSFEAEQFLKSSIEQLHDPYLLHGMDRAVSRIRQALEQKEHILIYGDYDADGVSSTSLMIRLMQHIGASFEYYIPHRSKEGYGLHNHALDQAKHRGVTLVITVDTGISAVQQIEYAKSLGIDVIVTDHHEPPAILPNAYTLVNPKLTECTYPFKGLAGVGVAYKLACALIGDVPEEWLQLVALGTIADLMPLSGENRVLVKLGLASMTEEPIPGIAALLRLAGHRDKSVHSTAVGFGLAPRINASGRLEHANKAVHLLITEDAEQSDEVATELDLLNRDRQQMVERIVSEATQQVEAKIREHRSVPDVIVIAGEGWNVGVVGIVASKILDRYYRPTIVLGIDADTGHCKGSARSIPGYDMYQALTACADLLEHYGGHPAAAGMSLDRVHLDEFELRLNQWGADWLTTEHFVPGLQADLECQLADITVPMIEELGLLAPYGMGNSCPRLLIRDAAVVDIRHMGQEGRHLKMTVKQGRATMEAVAFGRGYLADLIPINTAIQLIVEAEINEWNGNRKPQLMIQDINVSQLQVYDYRGTVSPERVLKELHLKQMQLPYSSAASSAAVCGKELAIRYNEQLSQTAVRVYDRDSGTVENQLTPSQSSSQAKVTSLYVLELPSTSDHWDTLLLQWPHLERIWLLQAKQERQHQLVAPSREQFKQIYALLRHYCQSSHTLDEIVNLLVRHSGLTKRMVQFILDVFEDLDFIKQNDGNLSLNGSPSKQPLDSSVKYQSLQLLAEMEQILSYGETEQVRQWISSRIQGAC
ncbi:single-stranded-DNA-specific exonuclease [Paenibacillus shirakamiensis]|uniref:Single-stranded-DNA-specific exonuclease RecJ n=1 Tax=Paenibacillus shirakamiensis TaxID=1265935 RepID=A0ABS4JBB9_9BACL|nr:single-stranded-DNA-specific exonuclease RecJ [Paenibacillus shirakamiensis]MBP1999008.1 single-stranded-DNA-specific exonuclease [Paenibacillus shirakamiensis]